MTSSAPSFRSLRNPIGCLILLAALALAAGCSTAETPSGSGGNMNHVLPSGSSVAGWVATPSGGTHASTATLDYIANGGSSGCAQCHGSDLATGSGGISKVSCSNPAAGCHHPATWGDPANHGRTAKGAPGAGSFFSCQICHGKDFSVPLGAVGSCGQCHGSSAPHPAAPWRGSPYSHATTNAENAPVCAQCHSLGSPNNPHPPQSPAPAGTAPGCFNGTMCHNQVGHPAGWVATPPAAQPHGNSAKAANGFPSCQTCHGNNFAGGTVNASCLNNASCHGAGVASPHPPGPWRTSAGSTYTHTNADETGNPPVCYTCHSYTGTANPNNPHPPPSPAPAGTPPGCFNGTMCHNEAVPHPVGGLWFALPPAPQVHGNAAKATPSSTTGFEYCKTCHGSGTNFDGGSSGVSCFTTCHFVNDTPPLATPPYPPHPAAPWRASAGSTYTHTSTDVGNAGVCAYCHRSSIPGTPGCFNNTLCHGEVGHQVPYNQPSHYAVTSGTFSGSCSPCHDLAPPSSKAGPVCQTCHVAASPLSATNCTSCHASPPDNTAPAGAVYPNIAGAHAVHLGLNSAGSPVTCDTCHNGLGPSLANLNHYNRAKSRVPPGDVAFLETYYARTGASTFDNTVTALSCSNVSCHGGVARSGGTPGTALNWRTGTLVVNNECTSCHELGSPQNPGFPQYNSEYSGRHSLHLANGVLGNNPSACKTCHNTTALAVNHFTALSTTAMEGPASATIGGTTYIPAGSYDPVTRSCNPSCHDPETWN